MNYAIITILKFCKLHKKRIKKLDFGYLGLITDISGYFSF